MEPGNQNHASLLTGPGVGAIAVIRLTGPAVGDFLARYFSKTAVENRCVHGILRDGGRIIDDIVAVRTGEFLDLNLHGGTWVVRSVLQLAERAGFQISDFKSQTQESEMWREVLDALPLAKTEQAVRMLLAQPAAWESIPDPKRMLDDPCGQWLVRLPRVAIVGPANVGKSTLANQLFGQARSITADLPGTTRDWVGEVANLDGLAVMLVDTPGIRATDDPIEDAAIAGSAEQIRSADLVVLVLDQSMPLDQAMLEAHLNVVRVANKSDAPQWWDATAIQAIQTVAVDGRGVGALRAEIRRRFGWEPVEVSKPVWWTTRQRRELEKLIER